MAAFDEAVNEVIPKDDGRGVCRRVPVIDGLDVGPDGGAEAHGTGVAGGVEDAAGEVMGAEGLAGGSDRLDFSVAGGIMPGENTVSPPPDDFVVPDDHGAEGAALIFCEVGGSLGVC